MPTKWEQRLEIAAETLVLGFGIFLALIFIDRSAQTSYLRNHFWGLYGFSMLTSVGVFAIYYGAQWIQAAMAGSSARGEGSASMVADAPRNEGLVGI